MAFAEDLQELHHGEQEYCRKSGPLNSRAIETPAAALLNGLELVAAALAAAVLAALIAAIYVLSAPLAIFDDGAIINVKIHNRPEGAVVEYTLTAKDDPDTILTQGTLEMDQDTLHFTDLEPGTTYIVNYFTNEDGELKKLDEFEFTTPGGGKPNELPLAPEASGGDSEEPSPDNPPAAPGDDDQNEVPEENTEDTPPPVNPPYQPGGNKPGGSSPAPSAPTHTAGTPSIQNAWTVLDPIGDGIIGYTCEEIHTFQGIPSDQNTIEIVQNGAAVANYATSYDAATQTLTVTFTGNEIPLGKTATSTVTLTDENGQKGISSGTITAPGFSNLELSAVDNGDGTVSFTFSGTIIQPSEGSLELELVLLPDLDNSERQSILMSTSESSFTHTFTFPMNRPGQLLTAEATIFASWSLDPYSHILSQRIRLEYSHSSSAGIMTDAGLVDPVYDPVSGTWSASEVHFFQGLYGINESDCTFTVPDNVTPTQLYYPSTGEYSVDFQHNGVAPGTVSTVTMHYNDGSSDVSVTSSVTYPDAPASNALYSTAPAPAAPTAPEPPLTLTPGVSTSGSVRDVTLSGGDYSYVEQHTFTGVSGYVLGVEIHKNGYVSSVPYSIRRDGDTFTVTLDPQTLSQSSSTNSRVVIHWNHENGDPCTTQSSLSITPQLLQSNLP